MDFQVKIVLLAFVLSVVIASICVPLLKRLKVGQIEREDGPQSHLSKQGTPTMGGIVMILCLLLLGGFLYWNYGKTEPEVAQQLLPLLFVSIGFGMIGFIDDCKKLIGKNTKGLPPAAKMLGLLVVAVAFAVYIGCFSPIGTQTYIPFLKTYIELPLWVYIPFAICVMLATTNAINLTDGVDGLATSVTSIMITCLTVIGILFGCKEITIFGGILIGTSVGFLLFNLHPAKVMMGDTGSLLLGGAIAGMALALKMPLLLLVIALVPVIETISVILQVAHYKRTGNRIFKMAPIHHHFELSGWNENTIVSVFSVVTLILCIMGLISL